MCSDPIGRCRPIDGTVVEPRKLLFEGIFGNVYAGKFGIQSAAIKEVRTEGVANGASYYGTIAPRDGMKYLLQYFTYSCV